MKYLKQNELRESYLSFFEKKGHLRLGSFPLVPDNDKSLLLINSGMAPLKPYFTGAVQPPRKRVVTCQKCIRTPDIENVGKTARHGTFFEMLGNFSFGDYFKEEAIDWAWEYVTSIIGMPIDKLHVSIYEDDDEAFNIWHDRIGLASDRIVRLGKADNFWEHGIGPCGPCSELYFDRGEEHGCGSESCGVGCDCDRYIEFWNLVFTQFDKAEDGSYSRLSHPNIDTGMGLERLACVVQNVGGLFEVDAIRRIIDTICDIASVKYKEAPSRANELAALTEQNSSQGSTTYSKESAATMNSNASQGSTRSKEAAAAMDSRVTDISIRVITDHIRSTVMMASDLIIPSNEGRGYVLRRLLRRAVRHGRILGIKGNFLERLAETVIEESGGAYPELIEKKDYIKKVISTEEERFAVALDQGLVILNDYIGELKAVGKSVLDGGKAFILHDTYGFPLDLTREIAEEAGLEIDENGFKNNMSKQKEKARSAIKGHDASAWGSKIPDSVDMSVATEFTGYSEYASNARVLGIVKDDAAVDNIREGDTAIVILDRTSFYAESGGQMSDTGQILSADAAPERLSDAAPGRLVDAAPERLSDAALNQPAGADLGRLADAAPERLSDAALDQPADADLGRLSDAALDQPAGAAQVRSATNASVEIDVLGCSKIARSDGSGNSVYLHYCDVKAGALSVGDFVLTRIDATKRFDTAKNHTATHLLHQALKQTLGSHVHQAGSQVGSDRLRFDFTHFEQVSHDALQKIEDIVNEKILEAMPVKTEEMSLQEAKQTGAAALFGEKYGDVVRVVSSGDFSRELCGGTHVSNTIEIGLLTIVSEGSVAAGTRRIEAITGREAILRRKNNDAVLFTMSEALKVAPAELPGKIEVLAAGIREKERELSKMKDKMISDSVKEVTAKAKDINGVKLIVERIDHLDMDGLRNMADNIKARINTCVVVLASGKDGRVSFVTAADAGALERGVHSGNLIKEIAKAAGGGGGGRADLAQAGGKNVSQINGALEIAPGILERQLN